MSCWPEKTTLENTLDKIQKSFVNAYDKADEDQGSSEKSDDEKKKEAEEKKKQDDLVKKKLEFCGTCFNATVQAFKDCIISRARDYINVLNRLVPDEIRGRHGGNPEGIKSDNEEEKSEDNNNEENKTDQNEGSNNDNGNSGSDQSNEEK